MAAAAALLLTTSGCTRQTLSAAVYSCNIEFRGHSEEDIRRVVACRRGAQIAYDMTVEMATEVTKLVAVLEDAAIDKSRLSSMSDIDFDDTGARVQEGDAKDSALSEIGTEIVHRAQSRCQNVFRKTSDGRLACMTGIRNFRTRDFEKTLLSSVNVGELKMKLDAAGIPLSAEGPAGGGHGESKPAAAHH
jgi:hypothetical protein